MKLKLDENLGGTIVDLLRSAGHDLATIRGQNLSGATDREVIAACQKEHRCLVTLDMDFSNPLLFDPAKYAGIAVIRLPLRPAYEDILDACRTLVAGLAEQEIAGKLWIVRRGQIREYQQQDRAQ